MIHVGHVREIVRYPIKSMAGVPTDSAFIGWHGLEGDRRFAFRRINDKSGFPWLTASRLPELLLYQPMGLDENAEEPAPTHVRTPEGMNLALGSAELQDSVAEKFGSAVELMKLKHGIFDEASVSVINLATIAAIGVEAGQDLDTRRFRAEHRNRSRCDRTISGGSLDRWQVSVRQRRSWANTQYDDARCALCDDQSRPGYSQTRSTCYESRGVFER